MAKKKIPALFLLPSLLSAGATAPPTNDEIFDKLWVALEKNDASVLPQVRLVLEDTINYHDVFSPDTRKTAFEVLRDTNMTELLPLVQTIAAMDCRILEGGQKRELFDLVAIQEALDTLREWQDPSAIELNLQRLRLTPDSWLQTTAVENLRLLEYWQATSEIQQLLGELPQDLESLLTIRKSLEFLRDSPDTDPLACRPLLSLRESFPFCFGDELERWRCGTLVEDTAALLPRLGCPR